MNKATVPQMFTVYEVAERLHVHAKTVRGWIKSGELGHYDVGRYDLVSDEQLATFIEARRAD
jgi:excisionase family DNA binding protein